MSVYSTKTISREEAIAMLCQVWKMPHQMSNYELEEALFNFIGREGLPNSPLNNYIVKD